MHLYLAYMGDLALGLVNNALTEIGVGGVFRSRMKKDGQSRLLKHVLWAPKPDFGRC